MSTEDSVSLGDIPGLGPVRRQALEEVGIQDLPGLLSMKVAELAAVRGIGLWQARRIREYLRQRGLVLSDDEDGTVVVAHARTASDVAAVARAVTAMEEQAVREAEVEEEVEMLVHALEEARAQGGAVETPAAETASGVVLPNGDPAASTAGHAAEETSGQEADAEEEAPSGKKKRKGKGKGKKVAEADSPEDLREEVEIETPLGVVGEAAAEAPADDADDDEDVEADEDDYEDHGERNLQDEIRSQREQLPEAALALMEAIRQAAVTRQLTRQITRLLITAGEFATEDRPLSAKKQRRASEALTQVEAALQRAVERRTFRPADQKELAERIRRRRKALERLLEEDAE